MIRRTVIAVLLATLLAAAGWAQVDIEGDFSIQSVQAYTSFGLFMNALDGAANVDEQGMGPGFSELENKYVFGGLANINREEADQTFTAGSGAPLLLGYMSPGDFRWSAFSGTWFDPAANQAKSESILGGETTETVVDGTDSTDYVWYETETTIEYTDRVISDEFTKYGQFITQLGPANVGFVLGVGADNAFNSNNVFTETTTYQYNDAGAGNIPTPKVDYTSTYTDADYATGGGKTTSYGLEIPVYMETGDLAHSASLGFELERTDLSTSQTLAYTVPADNTVNPLDGGGNVNDTDLGAFGFTNAVPAAAANQFTQVPEFGSTTIGTVMPIDLDYTLYMPMLGEHEDNRLMGGISANAVLRGATSSTTEIWQLYDFTVGGDATESTRSEYEQTDELGTGLGGQVELMGGHSFYFEPADGITLGVEPGVSGSYGWGVGYDSGNNDVSDGVTVAQWAPADATIASATTVTRTDNDADGAFTSAVDTVTTVETRYQDAVIVGGAVTDRIDLTQISADFVLPASVRIQPGDWSFAVVLGSRPSVSFTQTTLSGSPDQSADTTSTVDGAGDPVGGTTVDALSAQETYSYTEWSWNAEAEHRIGLNMMLPAGVTVDVALNLSTGVANILDFQDFVIQAIVPLP